MIVVQSLTEWSEQMEEQKTCRKCGCTKPHSQFPDRKGSKDGKHSYCYACMRENSRKYYANETNREIQKRRMKSYNQRRKLDDPYRIGLSDAAKEFLGL